MLIASGVTARADYYKKVTSSSDLVAGATYIIACPDGGNGKAYVATSYSSTNNRLLATYENFSISGDIITPGTATFLEFTLGGETGKYTLQDNKTSNYLSCNKSTNLSEEGKPNSSNTTAKWSFIDSNAAIKSNSGSYYLALSTYNPNNNNNDLYFKAYTAFVTTPQAFLYRKISALTATITDAGYATFVPSENVQFSTGEAFIVTAANEVVTLEEVTQVPAGTPVLLKGAGTKQATIISSVTATTDYTNNLLHVSDGSINADSHVYVLSKKNGKVGFYLWTGESLASGKVYLTIPDGAREFIGFDDTTTTEIFQMEDARRKMEDTVYDLQGRKKANGELQRGLYIVNGKKVLIK